MKKIAILALSFVLTAGLFVGCGCTNRGSASTPTGMTDPIPTIATTEPTTRPTTRPTQPATQPSTEIPDATGTMTNPTETTGENTVSTAEGRTRNIVPRG